jgi:hypothetical protein
VKGFGAIYRRELAGLFLAPLAWILLFLSVPTTCRSWELPLSTAGWSPR